MTQIYIDFVITSKICNIDFSDLILLKTTSKHEIGDVSITGITLTYSEWSCETNSYDTTDPNDVARIFVQLLKANLKQIKARLKKVQASTVIYFVVRKDDPENDVVSLSIDYDIVQFCADLNAAIAFD